MVRSEKSSILPMVIMLILFCGGLIVAHAAIDSTIGRQIADLGIIIAYFGALILLKNH